MSSNTEPPLSETNVCEHGQIRSQHEQCVGYFTGMQSPRLNIGHVLLRSLSSYPPLRKSHAFVPKLQLRISFLLFRLCPCALKKFTPSQLTLAEPHATMEQKGCRAALACQRPVQCIPEANPTSAESAQINLLCCQPGSVSRTSPA